MSDPAQKEKAFDETVRTEVARGLYQEKEKKLSGQWDDFHNARNKNLPGSAAYCGLRV